MALINSFLNPLIYSIRIRKLCVALIELICRTASFTEPGEIERRIFLAPNKVCARSWSRAWKYRSSRSTKSGSTKFDGVENAHE